MKLHEDKNAFRVLLEQIHERTGYRTDVLEKDYYVVLMLRELAEKQETGLPAFFKGGTVLYKALKTTNRFSEDIDLSVDTHGCSRSQNVKRLELAAKKYTALGRDASAGRTNRSEVISIFTYEPITAYDANDALQRFGKLKIVAHPLPSVSRQQAWKSRPCSMSLPRRANRISYGSSTMLRRFPS